MYLWPCCVQCGAAGLATAGLVGLQSLSQGVAAKAFLSLQNVGVDHDIPWLGYCVSAACCAFALIMAISLPDMELPAADEGPGQEKRGATKPELR